MQAIPKFHSETNLLTGYREMQGLIEGHVTLIVAHPCQQPWAAKRRTMYEAEGKRVTILSQRQFDEILERRRAKDASR